MHRVPEDAVLPAGVQVGRCAGGMLPATPPTGFARVAFPAEPKTTLQQATPINNGLEGERDRSYEPSKSGKEDGRGRGRNGFRGRLGGGAKSPREAAREGAVFASWAL